MNRYARPIAIALILLTLLLALLATLSQTNLRPSPPTGREYQEPPVDTLQ